ncbi:hypothetical protein ABPG74_014240 [Tetrahymena malaccensis]
MLKNCTDQNLRLNSLEELKQNVEREKQYLLSKKQISYLDTEEQFLMKDQIISFLNSYLIGLTNKSSEEDNLLAIQAIKYLCRAQADLQVNKFGSFNCSYCFGKFSKQELEIELFYKLNMQNTQIPTVFTLRCGHTFHLNCFKELIKDFENAILQKINPDEQCECECPGCELGQESGIQVGEIYKFQTFYHQKNEQK